MTDKTKLANRRLAALMREAGASNKGLARRMCDYSRCDGGEPISPNHTNVDKWLNGETKRPRSRACHVMAKVLSRELGRPITPRDCGYDDVAPEQADATIEYPRTAAESVAALTSLASYDIKPDERRTMLQVVPAAWADLLVKAMFGSHGSELSPAEPRGITEVDVQAVRDATAMFSSYDYRYGGGRPKPLVATFLDNDVLPHLGRISPAHPLGREYFRESAALTRLAGWTAYDTGQHGLAQRYLYHGFRLARAAGDKPLCGRILAGMSHQANFLGHYDHAVQLARAAVYGAQGVATATCMALFHAMEARALASQGNQAATAAALSEAEGWMERSEPDDDPAWIHYFDRAELDAEFAHCFRDLGNAELATEHAMASIESSESIYVRSLSFCRTVLATSYLQSRELEQALSIARGVVDTAADLKSSRVLRYLDDFGNRLARYADSESVREFKEYVELKLPSIGAPLPRGLVIA